MIRIMMLAAFAATLACAGADDQPWNLASPHDRTQFVVRQTADDGLEYRVLLQSHGTRKVAVGWSKLGIVTKLSDDLMQKTWTVSDMTATLDFQMAERRDGVDAYTMVSGKRMANRDAYRAMALTFRDRETGRILRLEARAYDSGIAFRYVLPETSPFFHQLEREDTQFNIGLNGTHWGQSYDFVTMYHPSYETLYTDRPTGTAVGPEQGTGGTGWAMPSLFEKNGVYVLLHEAGLDATFHGSHLQPTAPHGIYAIAPPDPKESLGNGLNQPSALLPWTMPWRMMVVSDNLADIVESNLVFDLSPPSKIQDTGWIKPGVVSWNWWFDHDSGRDLAKLKRFIDQSAEMGWPYTLIDADWNLAAPDAMEQLVTYANAKGVKLLFWYNSGGRHNYVAYGPRNRLDDRIARRAEFAKLHKLGIAGIKVDFWQSDKQDIIKYYTELMDDAAEFHLMCDFHGSTIQRGWQRTWPNLMSMEAVAGAEFYTFDSDFDYSHQGPRQATILPFTRNVVGSMDFTPVLFSQSYVKRLTTNGFEAATAVVFESALQHFSDGPGSYAALPADWRGFLAQVPTVWDETRLLAGSPGKEVVIARRYGKRWYIAGINGEDKAKSVAFSLKGLRGLPKTATLLFDDGQNGFASKPWHGAGKPTMALRPYGGFVLIFE